MMSCLDLLLLFEKWWIDGVDVVERGCREVVC